MQADLPQRTYRIVERGGLWMIDLEHQEYGPYQSKTDARREVENCIRSDRQRGFDATLVEG
jgi:hypothetical protein